MKHVNKKIIGTVACALIALPSVSLAWEMSQTSGDSSQTISSDGSVSQTITSSDVVLKGKIDGYKVNLSWEKYEEDQDVLGYKIVLTNSTGEEKTLSVGADKTSLENWDAKAGKNVYQLFVMGTDGEIAHSNEVVLTMGPNGGYNFGTGTVQRGETKMMYGSGLTQEQKASMEELKKSLEEEIKTLRESITPDNIEDVKVKAETLKAQYLAKAESLGIPEVKKMIEARFQVFYNNQFNKKPEKSSSNDDRKEQVRKILEQKREQMDTLKTQKKTQVQEVKDTYTQKKVDLKAKYKEAFTKKLAGKLDNLSAEKLKAIVSKVDSLIEKYQANETLSSNQKEKFVAQLNAVKEILQNKIDDMENSINLDEILN